MLAKGKGNIVTFYSYKGGVGRTMALANVAFLAAMSGKRVLVMDWDLEAPGLHYYFRGFMDIADARAFKDSPGILDILWLWRNVLGDAKTPSAAKKAMEPFHDGDIFSTYVRNIHLPDGAKGHLDFISAGGSRINAPEPKPYEEALAHFSWPDFFSNLAGGAMLQELRDWAKKNYDYILIDSRTGLADVSGVCTIQLPDTVALCFIMNRQNIDGVARVSAAIRAKRKGEVEIRAVPMRVAQSGGGVEADAYARAAHELQKIGCFSADQVQQDFRILPVRAEGGLPYYETLAPIIATEPATDPLTLSYQRLGTYLLNTKLDLPVFDLQWINSVKRRLQPKHATVDYISKLRSSDPIRTKAELEGLIESALQDVTDGIELDSDYISTLVIATIELSNYYGDNAALDLAMELCRVLASGDPSKWNHLLVGTLQAHINEAQYFMDYEEQLALYEELDGLLISIGNVESLLTRAENRRQIARTYINLEDFEAARQTVSELRKIIKEISGFLSHLNDEQIDRYNISDIETDQISGDIYDKQKNFDKAIDRYEKSLGKISLIQERQGKIDHQKITSEIYSKLARVYDSLENNQMAAEYCILSAKIGANIGNILYSFTEFSKIVIGVENNSLLSEFCILALEPGERRTANQYANYYGRLPRTATDFVNTSIIITEILMITVDENNKRVITSLCEITCLLITIVARRKTTIRDNRINNLIEPSMRYANLLLHSELYKDCGFHLRGTLDEMLMSQKRQMP